MTTSEFQSELDNAISIYEDAIGNIAIRTRQMINHYGSVEALSRLMISPDLQKGFRVLRDQGNLDKSFEAVVLKFPALFSNDVVAAAKWRLENADELDT